MVMKLSTRITLKPQLLGYQLTVLRS